MEIIIGKTAGFCYGVKRAVEGTIQHIKENKNISCLGELVHNRQVIEELEKQGLQIVENIDEINNNSKKVIIRAHGVDEKIYTIAKEKKIEIIDYTCPYVLKIHEIAKKYRKNGYYIFIIGSAIHPEVIGISSCCGENFTIIKDEKEIDEAILELKESKINKLLVIVQTTYNRDKYNKIKDNVSNKAKDIAKIVCEDTICSATEIRQKETREISSKVDLMIIIGGKNSSNTKKLYEISKENCSNVICIETKEELNGEFDKYNKIGIMAGASTPQKSIEEVIDKIKETLQF